MANDMKTSEVLGADTFALLAQPVRLVQPETLAGRRLLLIGHRGAFELAFEREPAVLADLMVVLRRGRRLEEAVIESLCR